MGVNGVKEFGGVSGCFARYYDALRFLSFVSLFPAANISVIKTLVLQPENDTSVNLKAYLYAPYLSLFLFLILFNDFLCKAKMILCTCRVSIIEDNW